MARVRVCFWVDLEPVPGPTKAPSGAKGSETNPFLGFGEVNVGDLAKKAALDHKQYAGLILKK